MITVRVYNNDRVARQFRDLGLKVHDLKDAWKRIGAEVKKDAVALTPVKSGRLARSIRAGASKKSAVVRAGNKRVVYAGVQNYGHYNNIRAKHFMNRALLGNADFAQSELSKEIERLINRSGLG